MTVGEKTFDIYVCVCQDSRLSAIQNGKKRLRHDYVHKHSNELFWENVFGVNAEHGAKT